MRNKHQNKHPGEHRLLARQGFTLIELMVALVISAGLLLAGRLLLEQITTAEHVITTNVAEQDTVFHHARLLESLLRNVDVNTDSMDIVHGDDHLVRFASWCEDTTAMPIPRTPCLVQLTIDTVVTVTTAVAAAPISAPGPATGTTTVVRRLPTAGVFRYLADARDGGVWYRSWGPSLLPPLALGIIAGADTTVLRIGDRG